MVEPFFYSVENVLCVWTRLNPDGAVQVGPRLSFSYEAAPEAAPFGAFEGDVVSCALFVVAEVARW